MKKKQAEHSRGKVRNARQVTLSDRLPRQLWLEERAAKSYAFALANSVRDARLFLLFKACRILKKIVYLLGGVIK